MNHDKPIFSKSQAGAEMFAAPDPTMRTRTRDFIQNYLTNILGQNTARQYAENIAGADPNNPMPRNPLGIGAADFTPLGLLFAGQEIKRDFDKASRPLDYVAPTIGGALSVAEAFPLTKVMVRGVSKPVVGFLSNLNRKSVDSEADLKIPEKPEPLMTSPGPKTTRDDETNVKPPKKGVSRRNVLKGIAAAPVAAGALSEIPAGKLIEDIAPVAKKAIPKLPTDVTSLSSFQKAMDMLNMEVGIDEAGMMTKQELKDIGIADPDNMIDDDFIQIGRAVEEQSSFPMSELEILDMESTNIKRYLDGEISLDEVDTGSVPVAGPVLRQLETVYKLDKKQIRDYLIENEVLED